jgi:hypothetical protein
MDKVRDIVHFHLLRNKDICLINESRVHRSRETCCLDMTVLHIRCTSRLSFVVDTILSLMDLSVYLLYLYFNFILINSI